MKIKFRVPKTAEEKKEARKEAFIWGYCLGLPWPAIIGLVLGGLVGTVIGIGVGVSVMAAIGYFKPTTDL
jgi:hypothetical protein